VYGNHAKIQMMKAILPKPVHESYKRYRKQLITQIILPMVIAGLLFVALIVLIYFATFRDNGDVARWAAISTIWIVIPIMIASLIFLLVLGGLVYLMKRLLNITPTYTGLAQDFVHKLAIRIRLAADAIVKPVIFVDGIGASINRLLGKK
jgi:heme/copper-type cytochrome/quinol oxidase subunit 2